METYTQTMSSSSLARQSLVDPGLLEELRPSANQSGFNFLRFRDNTFLEGMGLSALSPTPSNPEGPMFFCWGCLP